MCWLQRGDFFICVDSKNLFLVDNKLYYNIVYCDDELKAKMENYKKSHEFSVINQIAFFIIKIGLGISTVNEDNFSEKFQQF